MKRRFDGGSSDDSEFGGDIRRSLSCRAGRRLWSEGVG